MYSAGKETGLFFKKGGWHQRCTIHVTFNTYDKRYTSIKDDSVAE